MSDFVRIVTTAVLVLAILALVVLVFWVRRRRHRRRLPSKIAGIRIEVLPVRCTDDLIVERMWRIPLVMTNATNHPASVPPLAARREIRTRRKTFVASTSVESDVSELNPGSELIGWVEVLLPAAELPRRVTIPVLGERDGPGLTLTATLAVAADAAVSRLRIDA